VPAVVEVVAAVVVVLVVGRTGALVVVVDVVWTPDNELLVLRLEVELVLG